MCAPALPPRSLRAVGLSGGRGDKTLFSGLEFGVEPGQMLLLRGPNGAGKTSLLLVLAGILRPFGGSVEILGGDPESDPMRDVGYYGHRPAIKPRLSVHDNLRFWALVLGSAATPVGEALERVGLGALAWLDAGNLSAGQTRRLALARLLVGSRPVWLLDEPLSALDADGEALVGELLAAHLARGGLAVAATHHDIALPEPGRVTTLTLGGGQ